MTGSSPTSSEMENSKQFQKIDGNINGGRMLMVKFGMTSAIREKNIYHNFKRNSTSPARSTHRTLSTNFMRTKCRSISNDLEHSA